MIAERALGFDRAPSDGELRQLGFSFHVPEVEDVDVVVVDDDKTSLELMEAFVRRIGHPVRAFADPRKALEAIQADPPRILVTDMVMADMSGVDLGRAARAVDPDIAVVLVTGVGDQGTAQATVQLGVSSFVTKPLELNALTRALQRAFLRRAADDHHRAMVNWMYEAMDRNAQAIREVTLGTLTSLTNALDARSPHFKGHSRAVALQAAALAQVLGLDEQQVETVRVAGMLHDIGMIGVSDSIVERPGPLMPKEIELVRSHCEAGASIIAPMKHLGEAIRYVLEHHERWDGSGYPDAKKGDEISLGGQIVGISETWTAILENRPYREGRSRDEGMEILLAHEGQWFTEKVTRALTESDIGLI
jgi:putative two-component system response regulator